MAYWDFDNVLCLQLLTITCLTLGSFTEWYLKVFSFQCACYTSEFRNYLISKSRNTILNNNGSKKHECSLLKLLNKFWETEYFRSFKVYLLKGVLLNSSDFNMFTNFLIFFFLLFFLFLSWAGLSGYSLMERV